MEGKNANLWWDAVQDIVQKDIKKFTKSIRGMKGYTNKRFLRQKKLQQWDQTHITSNLYLQQQLRVTIKLQSQEQIATYRQRTVQLPIEASEEQ